MRILWVKMGGLWPLNTGGRLRSFHILSELSCRHPVTLLTTHEPGEDPAEWAARLPHGVKVLSVPYRIPKFGTARFGLALLRSHLSRLPVDLMKFRVPAVYQEVRRLFAAREVDLCVADFLSATVVIPLDGPIPVVFFAHNVEYKIWERLARIETGTFRRLLLENEWRKMRRCEARVCRRAGLTVAVSDVDRAIFSELAPAAGVSTIPTGVDTDYFSPNGAVESPNHLVFSGSMDWRPNEDAVLNFIETILPRIRAEVPHVTLTVVGRNPTPRLQKRASEAGACVTGTVEDVRPYIAEAAVVVVPLRVGGGTRLKIFEALAMGKAVVSTTIGAEGLPLIPGEHFILADDPAEWGHAVVSLLRDPERRQSLGAAGRRLIERYSWERVAREFEATCDEAVGRSGHRRSPTPMGNEGDSQNSSQREREGATQAPIKTMIKRFLPRWIRRPIRACRDLGPEGLAAYAKLRFLRAMAHDDGDKTVAGRIGTILFVCRGNVIRSPMAAALLRRRLSEFGLDGLSVSSAGLHVNGSLRADARALKIAGEFGVTLEDHRAQPVTPALVARADAIVAMDLFNLAELCRRYPEAGPRTVLLTAYAEGDRRGRIEIADPSEGGETEVRLCYETIDACVRSMAKEVVMRCV
jgi:sugar transferase (PEP-CTERM/EpsH1 system associated)